MTTAVATQDFKVADLSLAEFGRKEILLAELGQAQIRPDFS